MQHPSYAYAAFRARLVTAVVTVVALGGLVTLPAYAEKVIWHYDDLPSDMNNVANGLANHPKYVHPGFIQGEAFGQLFKPKAADYPVKILSVELVMAQAPKEKAVQKLNATIEIWNDDSVGAAPTSAKPVWTVNTADFFNPKTGQPGTPVEGNTGMVYEFDWSKPENHPPLIDKGTIRVVIRINDQAKDLQAMWDTAGCMKTNIGGFDIGCGCQTVAPITDTVTTPGVNLMHLVWPLGSCTGSKQWKFVEQLSKDGFTMKGDFVLRMGVDGVPPVVDVDAGPSVDAGSPDAGPAKDVAAPPQDTGPPQDSGPKVEKPVVDLVTPSSGPTDKVVTVDVIGKHFVDGATVKIGSTPASVTKVTPTTLTIHVMPGITPGTYAVVVNHPNGDVAFKDAAYTVTAAAAVDAGPTDTGSVDTGPDVTVAPAEAPVIDLVTPSSGRNDQVVKVDIVGKHFEKGATVKIGVTAANVETVTATTLTVNVLPGLAPGKYAIVVTNPNSQVGFKQDGYEVLAPPQDTSGHEIATADAGPDASNVVFVAQPVNNGCSAGATTSARPWALLMAFAGLGLWLARRRRPATR